MMRVQMASTQMTQQYNEVVVGTERYVSNLPSSLEAFVTIDAGDRSVRAAHAAFLRHYGLRRRDCPLLLYRPDEAGGAFRDIS